MENVKANDTGCFVNITEINLSQKKMKQRRHNLRESYRNSQSPRGVLWKKFTKFTGKHLRQSLFSIKSQVEACNFIKKETLTHVFCCTFCEFFKNTFFIEHFRWLLLKMLKSESESLFNKVAEAFRLATLLKRDSNTDAFLSNLWNL